MSAEPYSREDLHGMVSGLRSGKPNTAHNLGEISGIFRHV